MADYDFDDAAIQNFLDPLFSYLSTVLPAPIYSIVEALITHTLTLLSALLNFALALATAQNWDAQKILPPLITLLAAYLALVSFYRTTGWMIRTAFWFVKWGGILVALSAGAGYFLANAGIDGGNNGVGAFNGNLLSFFGNALLGLFDNEDSQSGRTRPARSSRSRTGPNTRSQTKKHKEKERPKAWESWDKQRDWRHTAEAAGRDDAARMNEGVQEAVQKVTGLVRDALGTGWWEVVKNAVGSGLAGTTDERQEASQSRRKTKQDTKGRGSSR
ncbi:hypothetical protein DICSQDRAFT_110601 [Dichomitus squalens LYAD-421 SS1]|uniref:Uncharacterized protein n=1 Tax=Dichomitus squalens (strain LYAD-421) TaxID=732165 RepID=R7SQ02_DICSQ|nr:uncharacterized protein DICSQDRAFT_110601 [Dichomitus squalens LYAD-421 SS1]EJF58249.1 hypothetical protein DICSQDRAFT_110601 [Dichomitus squalens LYAD-421 SS1]